MAINKLYKKTTHGARKRGQVTAERASMRRERNIYMMRRDYAGGFTLRRALNRSFRMKRIGGSATWVVVRERRGEGSGRISHTHGALEIRPNSIRTRTFSLIVRRLV